jgi:DNA-binding NtrC family response regulator
MSDDTVLLVDDDDSMRRVLEYHLEHEAYGVKTVPSAERALEVLERGGVDLVMTDVRMAGMDGMTLLRRIRGDFPDLPVIVLTAHGTIEMAVEAMKVGAVDYLTKPIDRDALVIAVKKALEVRDLARENLTLRDELERRSRFDTLVGVSEAIEAVREAIRQAAASESTVLITGESGTGKELVARSIHGMSRRGRRPLVTVNCAGIPRELLESELFGHVRGAFTGATADKPGKFQLADGGTLFLDEVGDTEPGLQAKLLRAIQEREVERVGGRRPERVDIRVVSATNQDLPHRIRAGSFREDLYYRLNVFPIHVPPLRERPADVPPLVEHLALKHGRGRRMIFEDGALEVLAAHPWPGNVRELENLVERLAVSVLAGGGREEARITPDMIRPRLVPGSAAAPSVEAEADLPTLAESEVRLIREALRRAGGNKTWAARLLGVPRHVLLYRMKKFQIA